MGDHLLPVLPGLLTAVAAEGRAALGRAGTIEIAARRTIVQRQGARTAELAILLRGAALLTRTTPTGHEAVLDVVRVGDLMGLDALTGDPHSCSVRTLASSAVLLVPAATLLDVVVASRRGLVDLVGQILRHLGTAQDWRATRATADTRQRLLTTLLDLSVRFGRQDGEATVIDLPLTHGELASMVGAARETVSKLLTVLRVDGVLVGNGQRLRLDHRALRVAVDDALAPPVGHGTVDQGHPELAPAST